MIRLTCTYARATLAALVWMAACAFDVADQDEATTGGTGGLGTGGGAGSGAGGSTGGEPTTGGGDGGSDGVGPGDAPNACDGVKCGAGICVVGEDDKPRCECDEGFVAVGLSCQACGPLGAAIDLPTATLELTFTLNGQAPPANPAERGDIYLRDRATGAQVLVGPTHEGGGQARVLHGTYDVIYSFVNGGNLVPINQAALVGQVIVAGDMAANVDIPMASVTGEVLLNGEPSPYLPAERGDVELVGTVIEGDRAKIASTGQGTYWANVVPGIYEVHYRRQQGTGSKMPFNGDVIVKWVEIGPECMGEVPCDLYVDLTPTPIQGTLQIGGKTPPAAASDRGTILLVDPATGDEMEVAQTQNGSNFTTPMVQPGSYRVIYRRDQNSGGQVPANPFVVVQDELVVKTNNPRLDLDLNMVQLVGTITVAGGPPPADPDTAGEIVLRDGSGRDEIVLARTDAGAFDVSAILPSEGYGLYYRFAAGPEVMPVNTGALLRSVQSPADLTNVDLPVQTISGTITVNGGAPPASAFDYGLLSLRDPQTGDVAFLGTTQGGSFSRAILPGSYELHYQVGLSGDTMPINVDSVAGGGVMVTAGMDEQLDVTLSSAKVSAGTTINGAPAPAAPAERGRLYLVDVNTGARVPLGTTDAVLAAQLLPGRYVVEYELVNGGFTVPRNPRAAVSCVEVQ